MKLFLTILLSVLSYHCCSGYLVVEGELSEDFENATSLEYWFSASNKTASNDSAALEMHGLGKEVAEKIKEGIKTVKDKVESGFDTVKDKVKDVFDRVKDKVKEVYDKANDEIKDFEDKIGSNGVSGGGSVGGYYRDKNGRDKHDRNNNLKDNNSGGSGFSEPNAKWISLGIGIFMLVCILGVIICFICKVEKD